MGSTLAANHAGGAGGAIFQLRASASLEASIVWGNCADNGDQWDCEESGTMAQHCSDVRMSDEERLCNSVVQQPTYNQDPLFCCLPPCRVAPTVAGDYTVLPESICWPDNNACGVLIGAHDGLCVPVYAPMDMDNRFQDVGPTSSELYDPRATGPANVAHDLNGDLEDQPDVCGDSLVVWGSIPDPDDPNTRWEARLWFRVAKRGAFQTSYEDGEPTRYEIWKDRVADGKDIDRPHDPEFAFGWMDSVQVGFVTMRNKFCSYFREDDDDFRGENFDGSNPETEILWDDAFCPGTRIEYFATANYVICPNVLTYFPDTTGGNFFEFEILPGLRTAHVPACAESDTVDYCVFQPATLYIDVHNGGSQFYIENALRTILNGLDVCTDDEGCPIPTNRNWDRYDYLDATSNWNAPFARGAIPGSNNGMTLAQILGYRTILVSAGPYGAGAMEEADFELFWNWIATNECNANVNRQVFAIDGGDIGALLDDLPIHGQPFYHQILGAATYTAREETPRQVWNWILPPPDQTDLMIDVSGGITVLETVGGSYGSRCYLEDVGFDPICYGQIRNESLPDNYRAITTGVGWPQMCSHPPFTSCSGFSGVITFSAIISELGDALRWGFEVEDLEQIPKLTSVKEISDCYDTWYTMPAGMEDDGGFAKVNRLYWAAPNPSNPTTSIRFSVAAEAKVELLIYNVSGRRVRTLVNDIREAGAHTIVWDGKDDVGRPVASGIFWVQMRTGSFESNKRLVVLK
jgi:hypothetical protein